jgi:hypothetical protein
MEAKRNEYWSRYHDRTVNHIRDIWFDGSVHHKMERMNEIRDRKKVMHGLKNLDTPILKGIQVCHDFIKIA